MPNSSLNSSMSNSSYAASYPRPGTVEISFRILLALFILLLNAFILLVFLRMKRISFSNLLFISLAISDFFVGAQLPLTLVLEISFIWPFGKFMCLFYNIWSSSQLWVSNTMTVVMSIHRFIQLFRPFRSHEKINIKKLIMLSTAWLFPYSYVTLMILVLFFTKNVDLEFCSVTIPKSYFGYHVIFVNLVPSVISLSLNFYNIRALYKKYQRNSGFTTTQRPRLQNKLHLSRGVVTDSSLTTQTTSTSIKALNKSSEVKISRTRRDLRAAICLLTIILNILISEFPLYIIYLSIAFFPSLLNFSLWSVSIKMIYLFPFFNPIILFVFNANFQKECLKFVGTVIFKIRMRLC